MFRRQRDPQPAPPSPPSAAPSPSRPTAGGSTVAPPPGVKGRPTPSRRDAEAERRKRARPPVDRKEERRRRREAVASQRTQVRTALATGDEKAYMPRDRGPVRRFVRDYVDSRRTAAEYFLPAVLLVFVMSLVPSVNVKAFASLLMLLIMVLVVTDTAFLAFRLRRRIAERFPDDTGGGHVFYGVTRSAQLRRFRLPKAKVRPGATV